MMERDIDGLILPIFQNPFLQPLTSAEINDPAFIQLRDYLKNSTLDAAALTNFDHGIHENTSDDICSVFSGCKSERSKCQELRTFLDYQGSKTVTASDLYESQKSSSNQRQNIQPGSSESGKIRIKSQPRKQFRPRTEKDRKYSSHYIRCEENSQYAYPTIDIPQLWAKQNNIIEVTVVSIDQQPHPYSIDNKERETSRLIFKQAEPNSLYFHLTEQDFKSGEKSFLIEYIKAKQDGTITKELIRTRQLDQSMLRFTRYYQLDDGAYNRDEESVEYSSIMTEDYGDFSVEDVIPLSGPMCGNQKICVEMKGTLPKDLKTDLNISITGNRIDPPFQVDNIKKNGNVITFYMPSMLHSQVIREKVSIIIRYKQDIIYQCRYLYSKKIEEELAEIDADDATATADVGCASIYNWNELTGALSDRNSIDDRGAKRFRQ